VVREGLEPLERVSEISNLLNFITHLSPEIPSIPRIWHSIWHCRRRRGVFAALCILCASLDFHVIGRELLTEVRLPYQPRRALKLVRTAHTRLRHRQFCMCASIEFKCFVDDVSPNRLCIAF
jgi:hypothetical protein